MISERLADEQKKNEATMMSLRYKNLSLPVSFHSKRLCLSTGLSDSDVAARLHAVAVLQRLELSLLLGLLPRHHLRALLT